MTRVLLRLAVPFLLACPHAAAAAAEVETRTFHVKIDGKPAGNYQMTIRHDNGTYTVTGEANVRLSYLIYRYTYTYAGTEVWKDGRLQRLDSNTNDDGKRFAVTAVADGDLVRVHANGTEHRSRPDVWTTTYWRLADAKLRNQAVTLLDADTGRDIRATLRYVGTQALTVAGQVQNCVHYSLAGGVKVELWYDDQERLVRQDSIEDGHRTMLELVRIAK